MRLNSRENIVIGKRLLDSWGGSWDDMQKSREVDILRDSVRGITCDLEDCVEVTYNRGATEYVRLSYPAQYNILSKGENND